MVTWNRCPCKAEVCKLVYPNMGTFYQGTGFTTEEAAKIDAAMQMFNALPKRDQYAALIQARKRVKEAFY